MGPTVINGLPAHVFLVHIVIVFVPLAAFLLVLSALWPAARRRLGVLTPVVALIALASVPLTTHAGEWLYRRVDRDPLVVAHARLADGLLPWSVGAFVVSVAIWVLYSKQFIGRRDEGPVRAPARVPVGATVRGSAGVGNAETEPVAAKSQTTPVSKWLLVARGVALVLALAVSIGSVVEVYRIGDAGARAAWTGGFSMTPQPNPAPNTDGH